MEKLNPKKTMWLSLIPGLGQLKNGQKRPVVRKNSGVSDLVLRTNAPKMALCP